MQLMSVGGKEVDRSRWKSSRHRDVRFRRRRAVLLLVVVVTGTVSPLAAAVTTQTLNRFFFMFMTFTVEARHPVSLS